MSWHLWLYKKLFTPPLPTIVEVDKVVYKVIEVKTPRTAQKWTKEVKDAVATLPSHPGFIAIQDRIALQKQMLEHKCSAEFHKDLRESDFLQAGVFWLAYLQRLIEEATQLPRAVPVDAYEEEMEAFRQIDSTIERIGMESGQDA
jgi:hypothetical protein